MEFYSNSQANRFKTHGASSEIRNAAILASQLYRAWESKNQTKVEQLQLFDRLGDDEGMGCKLPIRRTHQAVLGNWPKRIWNTIKDKKGYKYANRF